MTAETRNVPARTTTISQKVGSRSTHPVTGAPSCAHSDATPDVVVTDGAASASFRSSTRRTVCVVEEREAHAFWLCAPGRGEIRQVALPEPDEEDVVVRTL